MATSAIPPPVGDGRTLRLATRGSPLALVQAASVAAALQGAVPGLAVALVVVSTHGDRVDAPLSQIGGEGVFVKEEQAAVLEGAADAAVHSAKDLPPVTPDGLVVAAVPRRADPRDALVGCRLAELGPGATVATGSARRRAQLANLRPDLTFVELRGNIATRLAAAGGEVAAVVVAAAALERLDLAPPVTEVLPPSVCLPQIGQGALAVEARVDDPEVRAWLAATDHAPTHAALVAERSLLAALGADCSVPVAGWARWVDGHRGVDGHHGVDGADASGPGALLELEGLLASGDGRVVVRTARRGADPVALGREVATALFTECGAAAVAGWEPGGGHRGEPVLA